MPHEFRRITFTHAEVREAIGRSDTKPVKGSLGGEVTSLLPVHSNGDFLFQISMIDPAEGREHKAYFEEDDLIQAIIGHCRDQGIPLPRTSIKTLTVVEQEPVGELRVIDNRLCLDVSMGEMAVAEPGIDSGKDGD